MAKMITRTQIDSLLADIPGSSRERLIDLINDLILKYYRRDSRSVVAALQDLTIARDDMEWVSSEVKRFG